MRRYILTYTVISKANFSTHVKIKQRAVYKIIKFHALYRNKTSTKVQTLSIINILCRHTSIGAADVDTDEIHLRLEWKPNGSPRDHAKGKITKLQCSSLQHAYLSRDLQFNIAFSVLFQESATLKIYLTVCFDANSSVDHATDNKQTIDLSMKRLASFVIRANKPFKF